MTDREKLVKTAESYVGKNGNYVCNTKLHLGMVVDWCAYSISAIMQDCGFIGKYQGGIYGFASDAAREDNGKLGEWFRKGEKAPQPGDYIMFRYSDFTNVLDKYSASHVGIVESVEGDVITTLEGNVDGYNYAWAATSSFKRKTRYLSNPDVYAFYRPYWQDEKTPSKPTEKTADIEYQVNALTTWQPYVKNLTDYAGLQGRTIYAIRCKRSDVGDIRYRVHVIGIGWLPWVKNDEDYAGRIYKDIPIDGVQVHLDSAKYVVKYRVSAKDCNYYDWVTDYSGDPENGYAGEYGKPIDRLQMFIVKK